MHVFMLPTCRKASEKILKLTEKFKRTDIHVKQHLLIRFARALFILPVHILAYCNYNCTHAIL